MTPGQKELYKRYKQDLDGYTTKEVIEAFQKAMTEKFNSLWIDIRESKEMSENIQQGVKEMSDTMVSMLPFVGDDHRLRYKIINR